MICDEAVVIVILMTLSIETTVLFICAWKLRKMRGGTRRRREDAEMRGIRKHKQSPSRGKRYKKETSLDEESESDYETEHDVPRKKKGRG